MGRSGTVQGISELYGKPPKLLSPHTVYQAYPTPPTYSLPSAVILWFISNARWSAGAAECGREVAQGHCPRHARLLSVLVTVKGSVSADSFNRREAKRSKGLHVSR